MEKEEIEQFKQKLIALKKKYLKKSEDIKRGCLHKQMLNQTGNLSAHPIHIADISGDIYEQEMEIEKVSNLSNIISQIDEAMLKIENRTYGICEKCKGKIPRERLEILPFARFCTRCKEEYK